MIIDYQVLNVKELNVKLKSDFFLNLNQELST